MLDEALQVIRYTIDPQIPEADKLKPWIWMEKLRVHYTGSIGSSLLSDRFKFWKLNQALYETVQDWEVKVRQAGNLCEYAPISDKKCRDKFVFGLHNDILRTDLLRTHLKSDNSSKTMSDVVAEAKALEAAQKASKMMGSSASALEEQVNWTYDKQGQPDTKPCYWCGDPRGPHTRKMCPATERHCNKCNGRDHFARVCTETRSYQQYEPKPGRQNSRPVRGLGRGRPNINRSHMRSIASQPVDRRDLHLLHASEEEENAPP